MEHGAWSEEGERNLSNNMMAASFPFVCELGDHAFVL